MASYPISKWELPLPEKRIPTLRKESYRHCGSAVGLSCLSFVGNPFRGRSLSGTDEKEMTALISVGRMARSLRAVPSVADEWAVKNAAGRAFYYPIPAPAGAELSSCFIEKPAARRPLEYILTCTRK